MSAILLGTIQVAAAVPRPIAPVDALMGGARALVVSVVILFPVGPILMVAGPHAGCSSTSAPR